MIEKIVVSELASKWLCDNHTDISLVDVGVLPGNRIVVELWKKDGLSIEDCVSMSKFIENGLDRETEDFELEVGSCGITSPFKIPKQYEDSLDVEVEVLQKGGIKHKGILKSFSERCIELEVEKKILPDGKKRKITVNEIVRVEISDILQTKRIVNI